MFFKSGFRDIGLWIRGPSGQSCGSVTACTQDELYWQVEYHENILEMQAGIQAEPGTLAEDSTPIQEKVVRSKSQE